VGVYVHGVVSALMLTRPPTSCMAAGGPSLQPVQTWGKTDAEMKKLKLNEIKNGRLAMAGHVGPLGPGRC